MHMHGSHMVMTVPIVIGFFWSESALQQHQNAVHLVTCAICEKYYYSVEQLDAHTQKQHVNGHMCAYCRRVFWSKSALEQHQYAVH